MAESRTLTTTQLKILIKKFRDEATGLGLPATIYTGDDGDYIIKIGPRGPGALPTLRASRAKKAKPS